MWTKEHAKAWLKQYRPHVSEDVRRDLLDFHAVTVLGKPGPIPSQFVRADIFAMSREIQTQDDLLEPHLENCIPLPIISLSNRQFRKLTRTHSAWDFSRDQKIPDEEIKKIISASFCPMRDENGRRPYASAGALYPVNVFFYKFTDSNDFPAGFYHLLPRSRLLQARGKKLSMRLEGRLFDSGRLSPPTFSTIYVLNIERAVFKYSYRGYRHGLIEAGAMSQVLDNTAASLKFSARCLSGMYDNWLLEVLDLSPQIYLPLLIQQVGVEAPANA